MITVHTESFGAFSVHDPFGVVTRSCRVPESAGGGVGVERIARQAQRWRCDSPVAGSLPCRCMVAPGSSAPRVPLVLCANCSLAVTGADAEVRPATKVRARRAVGTAQALLTAWKQVNGGSHRSVAINCRGLQPSGIIRCARVHLHLRS